MRHDTVKGVEEEVELIKAIEHEMKEIKKTNLALIELSELFGVYGRINRVTSLCEFGRRHLRSLTLRGANQLRMVEIDVLERTKQIEAMIEKSQQPEILNLWKSHRESVC